MITISNLERAKRVNKPWGYELWIGHEQDLPYVMKMFCITAGCRTSLQVHQHKTETLMILDGNGVLSTSKDRLDCERWLRNDYSESERFFLWGSMRELPIKSGDLFGVEPGQIHRITAITDMRVIECSTTQLDDVIRLQDDDHRPNGRIDSEHA